jgi:hypothetical protein
VRYCVNSPQVINEVIDGEAIIINLVTGSYYSLDRVGSQVWSLVEASLAVDRIMAELDRRYDGEPDEIREAVNELLEQLSDEQLIVPCGEEESTAPPAAEMEANPQEPFRAPRLEKFNDMQDLILLDPVHEVGSRGWPHLPERATR